MTTQVTTGVIGDGAATLRTLDRTGVSGRVLTAQGSGNAPAWAVPASPTVFLGTVSTASGVNSTLTGLTLTGYTFLRLMLNAVSHAAATNQAIMLGNSTTDDVAITSAQGAGVSFTGQVLIDLATGVFSAPTVTILNGTCPITTASTVLSFAVNDGSAFDSGSIRVYGLV